MKRPRGGIPVRALVQTLRSHWGLRHRLAEQPARIPLRGIELNLDHAVVDRGIREMIYRGLYEDDEREILERTLRPDDRYLELGAGIGFIASCACRLIGGDRVVVYEANPELAALTEATARRNGFSPTVVNAVLGADDGEADFYVHDDFWTSSLAADAGGRRVRVPMRSLASELARFRPTYLMIDIEGGEVELLAHDALPDHVRAVCVETHAQAVGREAIQRLVLGLIGQGFTLDLDRSTRGVAYFEREAAGVVSPLALAEARA